MPWTSDGILFYGDDIIGLRQRKAEIEEKIRQLYNELYFIESRINCVAGVQSWSGGRSEIKNILGEEHDRRTTC